MDEIYAGMTSDLLGGGVQGGGVAIDAVNMSFSRAGQGLMISTVTVASPRKEGPRTGEAWITL